MQVTKYPKCENCALLEWYHPGGYCLYTPHKFKSGTSGIGVAKDKGIFYIEYWKAPNISRTVAKYIDPSPPYQDSFWPHSETIYWFHYLTEIGWKP